MDPDLALGELAVREGLCTLAQVRDAMDRQRGLANDGGVSVPLIDLLVDRDALTPGTAEKLLKLSATEFFGTKLAIPGYEIFQKVGHGSMGAVFKARQTSMDRLVAIKVLAPAMAKDPAYLGRFQREARACARLRHENIVSGLDVGEASGLHYFVMEFVEGRPLSSILARRGRLPEAECFRIATQVARALDHAHAQGLVHRDVKPENVLITADGTAKLCDLGLAKRVKIDPTLTMEGTTVGTPHYISPELARGDADIDARSDLYSLGAMLYRMATGAPPFPGSDAIVVMTKHVTEKPRPPNAGPVLDRLILRLMEKDRARRPASAADLLREIEALRAPKPASASAPVKVETPPPSPPPVRSRPAFADASAGRPASPPTANIAGGVGAIAVILVGLVAIYFLWPRGPSSLQPPANPPNEHAALRAQFEAQKKACFFGAVPDDILAVEATLQTARTRFAGTAHEAEWADAERDFRDEANRRVLTVWADTDVEVRRLLENARFAEATSKLDAFPRALIFFVPPPPGRPDAAVLTAAGARLRDARLSVQAKLAERLEADRRAFTDRLARRQYAEAFALAEALPSYAGPSVQAEADAKRADVIRRHLTDLPGDPPTLGGLRAAQAALADYRNRFCARLDVFPVLEEARIRIDALKAAAVDAARERFVAYAEKEFYPAVRTALRRRDFNAVRALYFDLFFNDPSERLPSELRDSELNLEALRRFLEKPPEEIGTVGSDGLGIADNMTLKRPGDPMAWLYLHLFEACTLEYCTGCFEQVLPDLLKDHYAFAASGLLASPAAGQVLRDNGRISVRFIVPAEGSVKTLTLAIAPSNEEPRLHIDDFNEALRRFYVRADENPAYLATAAILYFNEGDAYAPRARALFQETVSQVALRRNAFQLWLDRLADVATDAEEEEARRLIADVRKDVASPKTPTRQKAREACEKLLRRPLSAAKAVADRRKEIEAWLKALGGAAPAAAGPRTIADLFVVKPVERAGLLEWTYDFSDDRQFDDFLGRDGDRRPAKVKIESGALAVEGHGAALWKGELAGAFEIEAAITPVDDTDIGFATSSSGRAPDGDGYLLLFRPKFKGGAPFNHIMMKLPFDSEKGMPKPLETEIGKYTIKPDVPLKLRWTREEDDEMTVEVDGVKLMTAPGAAFPRGRVGPFVHASRARVTRLTIRGKLDEAWLKKEIED